MSNTDVGLSAHCGKGFFSQSQLSVQTLLQCPDGPCVQSHAPASMHMLKLQTLAAMPLFGNTKILHTLTGMGSAALVAAEPYHWQELPQVSFLS